MTMLGAAVYGGFFGFAALWLAATGREDQPQWQDRSNSASAEAGSVGSRPC